MSKGYVYILQNASMPGILKIGKTTRSVEQRCQELFATGVPTPFAVVDSVFAPDCHALESIVHAELQAKRVTAGREFFAIDAAEARNVLFENHHCQIADFVHEFDENVCLSFYGLEVDEVAIVALADDLQVHPFEVSAAMASMTAEELMPALERRRAAIAARRAEAGRPDGVTVQ